MKNYIRIITVIMTVFLLFSVTACDIFGINHNIDITDYEQFEPTPVDVDDDISQIFGGDNGNDTSIDQNNSNQVNDGVEGNQPHGNITGSDTNNEQDESNYIHYVLPSVEAKTGYDSGYYLSLTEEERLAKLNGITINNKEHINAQIDSNKVPPVLSNPEEYSEALRRSQLEYKTDDIKEALALVDLLYKNSRFFTSPCLYVFADFSDLPSVSQTTNITIGRPKQNEKGESILYSSSAEKGNHVFDRSDIRYLPGTSQNITGSIETNSGRVVSFTLSIKNYIPGYYSDSSSSENNKTHLTIPYMTYSDKFITDTKLGLNYIKGNPTSMTRNSHVVVNFFYFNTAEDNPYYVQRQNYNGKMVDMGVAYFYADFSFGDSSQLLTESELQGLSSQLYELLKTRIYVYDYNSYKQLNETWYSQNGLNNS